MPYSNRLKFYSDRIQRRWRKLALAMVALVIILAVFTVPQAIAQLSEPMPERLEALSPGSDANNFAVGDVYLDGRKVFSLTAPTLDAKQQEIITTSPVQQRVRTVSNQLQAIASDRFDAETLDVSYRLDDTSQLPVITVNGRYLVTVTTADARLYGVAPTTHAQNLTQTLKQALLTSQREQQPDFLAQQALRAGGVIFITFLISLGIYLRQRYIQSRYQGVLSQLEQLNAAQKQLNTGSDQEQDETAVYAAQQQQEIARKQRLKFWYEVRQRLLQLAQFMVWGSGIALCFSLFPQTRWVQSLFLTTLSTQILKLVLTGVATYLGLRLSFVAIDYLVAALSRGYFLPNSASVRTIKRLQTFSGVMKGASVFCCMIAGGLIALSILGVNIVPLLAGVSVFGIAISFGSQSLVKDMINGLFILLEDQYGVGDVITANNEAGIVEKMNLRVTQLRNLDGDLITIPNSSISMVKNHTSNWSRVNLGVDVAYDTDLDHAIAVIQKVATQISQETEWQELILAPPEVLGVDAFGENSITIRTVIQTQPLKQWDVGRELRRRLKYAFDREGISIPFPQRSIWFQNSLESTASNTKHSSHSKYSSN